MDQANGWIWWTGTKSDGTTEEFCDFSGEQVASTVASMYGYTSCALGWPNNRAEQYRQVRRELLRMTDYRLPSDRPSSSTTNLRTYRQALRDLPDHANWPNLGDDDWPNYTGD